MSLSECWRGYWTSPTSAALNPKNVGLLLQTNAARAYNLLCCFLSQTDAVSAVTYPGICLDGLTDCANTCSPCLRVYLFWSLKRKETTSAVWSSWSKSFKKSNWNCKISQRHRFWPLCVFITQLITSAVPWSCSAYRTFTLKAESWKRDSNICANTSRSAKLTFWRLTRCVMLRSVWVASSEARPTTGSWFLPIRWRGQLLVVVDTCAAVNAKQQLLSTT